MLNDLIAVSWVMIPLLLASVFSAAIILDRLLLLRSSKIIPTYFRQIHSLNDFKNTPNKDLQKSALGRIALAGVQAKSCAKKEMTLQAKEEIFAMERNLNLLGSIATITPLLGLLGTVLGMVTVFAAIMSGGLGQAEELAGGISEALLTTAVGVSIAIVAVFFYRLFNRHIDKLTMRLENFIENVSV
jgi:biopolymer transport protein ExbB